MALTAPHPVDLAPPGTLADRMLTASLVIAPVLYLVADTLYAAKGWTDPAAAVVHVLAATIYGLVVLRVAVWTSGGSGLTAALLFTAVAGSIGNAAYGFDTIQQSLGAVALVDQGGAAVLIKPMGLLFPLSLALVAWALHRLDLRVPALLTLVAAVAWPVAHIANIGPLAVATNVLLVIGFGSVAWEAAGRQGSSENRRSVP